MARVGEGIGLDLSPVIHALFQGEECDVSVLTFSCRRRKDARVGEG